MWGIPLQDSTHRQHNRESASDLAAMEVNSVLRNYFQGEVEALKMAPQDTLDPIDLPFSLAVLPYLGVPEQEAYEFAQFLKNRENRHLASEVSESTQRVARDEMQQVPTRPSNTFSPC